MQNLGSTPSQGVQSQPVIQIMTLKNCRGEFWGVAYQLLKPQILTLCAWVLFCHKCTNCHDYVLNLLYSAKEKDNYSPIYLGEV